MKTFLLVITMALCAVTAFAETYIWVDDQGTTNFADDLGNVPQKYRKKARIVGEEEPPAAETPEGKEMPAVQQQKRSPQMGKENGAASPAPKVDEKTVYGGKDAATWKYEFASARANLKAAEGQLVDTRERLKDTSVMSRSEYLSLQHTLKSIEYSVAGQRKRLEEMKQEAGKVGVPAELME
ncbi:MAG TPA: DUF4124 domain-containing protein [Geobacteraceae bacterium]|jgi:hypothetical protein|nr:DUF4124 domain-containing protein [Geobacteraceae bacterium]